MKAFASIGKIALIDKIKAEKTYLNEKYHVSEIGLFGSFARGEEKESSDIDLIVEFSKTPDIFIFAEIALYLKKRLGRKIDLTTKNALRQEIKSNILSEVQYL